MKIKRIELRTRAKYQHTYATLDCSVGYEGNAVFLDEPGELIKQLTPAHVQKVQGKEREN